jgi:hypothetical protein
LIVVTFHVKPRTHYYVKLLYQRGELAMKNIAGQRTIMHKNLQDIGASFPTASAN